MEKWKSSASGGGEEPARKVSGCRLLLYHRDATAGWGGCTWEVVFLSFVFFFFSQRMAGITPPPRARLAVKRAPFAGVYSEAVRGLDGGSEREDGKKQQQQEKEKEEGRGGRLVRDSLMLQGKFLCTRFSSAAVSHYIPERSCLSIQPASRQRSSKPPRAVQSLFHCRPHDGSE